VVLNKNEMKYNVYMTINVDPITGHKDPEEE
jgi:hypothetical protein